MGKVLAKDRIRGDINKSLIFEELGFGLTAWNQSPDSAATRIRLRCGGFVPEAPNVCLVELPSQGEGSQRLVEARLLARLLECMAVTWDPDWGVATSSAHRDHVYESGDAGTFAGWLMYFSRRRGTVPPLPAPVRIEPVESLGTLVILTPERFTLSSPEHVALAARVHTLLERAGLLKPIAT